jgi:hypothetical protein
MPPPICSHAAIAGAVHPIHAVAVGFDGDVRIMRWAMRDRRDCNLLASVGLRIRIINGENNGARPILPPLGLPALLFILSRGTSTK